MNLTTLRKRTPVLPIPEKRADARIAIAKDVLMTLDAKRLSVVARSGYVFIERGAVVPEYVVESFEALALAVRNPRSRAQCHVCAIGAAALSAVGLYDRADDLNDHWGENADDGDDYMGFYADSGLLRGLLGAWFTPNMLSLIECAFEETIFHGAKNSSPVDRKRASLFGKQFSDPELRLRAIMQNIVDNDGTFRP